WRPYQIWRHVVGTPATQDVLVYEDPDERFFVGVDLTRSEQYLIIGSGSKITSEWRLLPADRPLDEPRIIAPRREGVEDEVAHQGDRLLILHNDGALDYELATTPVENPGEWTPLIRHEPGTRLTSVDAFADHIVVSLRRDGLTGLRVVPNDGTSYDISFPE